LSDSFAICRLDPDAAIPEWAGGPFVSITRTTDELSIVCAQQGVPEDVRAERGWRCLRVVGTLDLSMVGVIARLTNVLAEAGISVFVVSSFDTDFVLLREANVNSAVQVLRQSGYVIDQR
jgi:hypothetical protein